MRVLLCLKSLSANSPLYICTKCFIYYKLVFCVAFFSFRSSTYTLAASFIHFRQLCKRSLFFICVMIYHCYFCDCFFFHSRLCLKIHFCYDSWPVSSGIHIYNLSPIYWHLFILTVLVSVWHVMYAYCIANHN